jgi:murein DD-endopeptidase MepM/ murein hydrolase activator NlpD
MRPPGALARAALAVVIAALVLAGAPGTGATAPPAPPNPSDDEIDAGRAGVQGAAREVGVLANRVAAAGAEIDAAQAELARTFESATRALQDRDAARVVAAAAQAVAESRRAEADAAGTEVRDAQQKLDEFAAASYRQGSVIGSVSGFLGSDDPEDLLARAELLDAVGGVQLDALEDLHRARVGRANQDSAARAALEEARNRQRASERAKVTADTAYAAAVAADAVAERHSAELLARKADLERQLDVAQRALAGLQGRRATYQDWQAARRAAEAAANRPRPPEPATGPPAAAGLLRPGGVVAPTTGRITSTYGPRWGSIHYGLDIANRIGTPIVSVMDGKVISAGPVSGFGRWVRVRHDDGTITVYGHVDEYLVSVGERVTAGEQIATIGNRGESTGPHLHFEVLHHGSRKIDPLVWLRGHGVSI